MSNIGAEHQEVTKIPDMDGTGPRWLDQRKFSCRGRVSFSDAQEDHKDSYDARNRDLNPVHLPEPVKRTWNTVLPRGCGRKFGRKLN